MGNQFGYKKYMKKEAQKDNSLIKIFIFSFFCMLLIFTFLIKSFTPSVDTSIGDYQKDSEISEGVNKVVDDRLSMIQDEDRGKDFTSMMSRAEDNTETISKTEKITAPAPEQPVSQSQSQGEPVYKVFVGAYTSAEQAKVAKDIIQETGNGLNPIVKCIGSNNYTLQVGIFKNKQSAEALLYTVQQSNLPGRIVQDY